MPISYYYGPYYLLLDVKTSRYHVFYAGGTLGGANRKFCAYLVLERHALTTPMLSTKTWQIYEIISTDPFQN